MDTNWHLLDSWNAEKKKKIAFYIDLSNILCIIIGISNMKGNIKLLHVYHRYRVSEENRLPFGKNVGIGTIIVGGSIVFNTFVNIVDNKNLYFVGNIIFISGMVVGLIFIFFAMFKYNKGIF